MVYILIAEEAGNEKFMGVYKSLADALRELEEHIILMVNGKCLWQARGFMRCSPQLPLGYRRALLLRGRPGFWESVFNVHDKKCGAECDHGFRVVECDVSTHVQTDVWSSFRGEE